MTVDMTNFHQGTDTHLQPAHKKSGPGFAIIFTGFLIMIGCILGVLANQTKIEINTIYEDYFSNNNHNWKFRNDEVVQHGIKNGKFIITPGVETETWLHWKKDTNIDFKKDFIISVSTKKATKDFSNNGYGVYFAGKGSSQFYAFVITGNGHYAIYKYTGGKYTMLKKWAKSSVIHKGKGLNTLRIERESKRLTFFINSNNLVTIPMPHIFGDYVGFSVSKSQTIAFDNFTIRKKNKISYLTWLNKLLAEQM